MTDENVALFREIFEHAPVGIAITDWRGQFEQCNPAYCGLLGYEQSELIGLNFLEFVHPDDAAANTILIERLRAGEVKAFDVDNRYRAKSGREVPVRKHVFSLPEGSNGAGKIIALVTNMTEQNVAAEELSRMRRMEAIGRLASGVAHDSNNILAVISGNLNLALRHVDSEPASEKIRNALNAAEIGTAFNRRLLSIAGRRSYAPEVCNLNVRIRTASALLDRVLGESVDLVLDLDEDLSSCRADPGEVDSAVLNLVTNARDAMPDGGEIIIKTRNMKRTDTDHPSELLSFIELTVCDNGHGMAPEVMRRATEPFFTTKPRDKGTGLGLSSVMAFARQAGGSVEMESNPGDGTTVSIRLPAAS